MAPTKRKRPVKAKKPKSKGNPQKYAKAFVEAQTRMKDAIEDMEESLEELLHLAAPGDSFVIGGVSYTVVDNFADKNTAFKASAFRRFDLKATK